MWKYLLFLIVIISSPTYQSAIPSGSIELDEVSFDKIVNKFDAAIVKFDVAFPYGEKHEAFVTLARDTKDIDDLIVAEVGVKDYGEKDNEELAKKYGAHKDIFPVVKLFIKGKSDPITFDDSKGFTTDELRKFVREKSGIYLSLPGCVKELDTLTMDFMKSSNENRKKILNKFDNVQKTLDSKLSSSVKVYKTLMEKIMDKGDEFIATEYERVKKLISGKLSEDKKKDMGTRLNIIQTFQLSKKEKKDEL